MSSERFASGTWIRDYQVDRHLRSGGMADVYLARRFGSAGWSDRVALKMIKPKLSADERFVKLFIDEARISARIKHPNVVRVLDFGEADEGLFMAMDYVVGWSAGQILRAASRAGAELSVELVVYMGICIADGLEGAHTTCDAKNNPLGILHCDVTPSNILLGSNGDAKLIDFGVAIARRWLSEHAEAEAAPLKGKLRYMAPEQIRSEPACERADVYALGIVLWELLAAAKAFEASSEDELLEMVLFPNVRDICEVRPSVSRSVGDVIHRAISAEAKDRPGSASEFSKELARACPAAMLVDSDAIKSIVTTLPIDSADDQSWVSEMVRAYLVDDESIELIEFGQRS